LDLFWFCLLLLTPSPDLINERRLGKEIDRVLSAQNLEDGFWGISVYSPARGRTIYARNPRNNFRTASNMKILTTLLAMDTLGPEYRFETRFGTNGDIRNGILVGDLYVIGGGDPAISGNYSEGVWTSEDLLAPIIAELRAAGIRQIAGNLVAVEDFFTGPSIQRSWEWDDVGTSYTTPVTALAIDNGWIEISLETDELGAMTYRVTHEPEPDVVLEFNLTHDPGKMNLNIQRKWGTDTITFSGNMPPCSQRYLTLSSWTPQKRFLTRFRAMLAGEGIAVLGKDEITNNAIDMRLLSVYQSDFLAELAKTLMKDSQNHHADLFLATTVRHALGEVSIVSGADLAAAFVDELAPNGASGFNTRDGSGLSVQNYLSPEHIIALLRYGLNQDYVQAWLATFPVMGEDGTLRRRGADTKLEGRVWAKTGYIYRARNLSGYVETAAGEPLIFSILVNNYGTATAEINQAQDALCGLLTRLKPNRAVRRGTTWNSLLSNLSAGEQRALSAY
jgi:D-alanyl-D-alanine carboxypeptidase/D-alanyl-D-alanine-endopeptidase (penicillin-binding protein 4)